MSYQGIYHDHLTAVTFKQKKQRADLLSSTSAFTWLWG